MFLKPDNTIKWNWVLSGGLITLTLMIFCFLFFDFYFVGVSHNFKFDLWNLFEFIFDAKVWLAATAIWAGFGFVKLIIKSKLKIIKFVKKFFQNVDSFKKTSIKNYGFMVFLSVFMACGVGYILKFLIGRQRPVFFEALGQSGFDSMTSSWAYHSMPSGHTIVSFAGLVMIGMLYPKLKPYTWTIAIVIGFSRILSGAHFPSDVILAAFLGMIIADFVKSYFFKK